MTRLRTESIPVLMLVLYVGCSSPSNQPARKESAEFEWEARIVYESPGQRLECVIENGDLIRQLILAPTSGATKDENPAKYEVAGEMSLRRPSGEVSNYYLFAGFRHYKSGGEYFTADLTKLEDYILANGVAKPPGADWEPWPKK